MTQTGRDIVEALVRLMPHGTEAERLAAADAVLDVAAGEAIDDVVARLGAAGAQSAGLDELLAAP